MLINLYCEKKFKNPLLRKHSQRKRFRDVFAVESAGAFKDASRFSSFQSVSHRTWSKSMRRRHANLHSKKKKIKYLGPAWYPGG